MSDDLVRPTLRALRDEVAGVGWQHHLQSVLVAAGLFAFGVFFGIEFTVRKYLIARQQLGPTPFETTVVEHGMRAWYDTAAPLALLGAATGLLGGVGLSLWGDTDGE